MTKPPLASDPVQLQSELISEALSAHRRVELATEATRLFPDAPWAWAHLTRGYLERGAIDDALRAGVAGLRAVGHAVEIWEALRPALWRTQDPDAMQLAASVLALHAQALLQAGQVAEARAMAEELVEHAAASPLGWTLLASACAAQGDFAAALAAQERAIEHAGGHAGEPVAVESWEALFLYRLACQGDVLAQGAPVLLEHPRRPLLWYVWAQALRRQGRGPAALLAATLARALAPMDAAIQMLHDELVASAPGAQDQARELARAAAGADSIDTWRGLARQVIEHADTGRAENLRGPARVRPARPGGSD